MDVQKLVVVCDLVSLSADRRSASLSLAQYAVLAHGSRLLLHNDRGWSGTVHYYGHAGPEDPVHLAYSFAVEHLLRDLRTTLLPDEGAEPDDHDWHRLVALLANFGVTTTREQLRSMPYEVEFTDRLLAQLDADDAVKAPFLIDWDSLPTDAE